MDRFEELLYTYCMNEGCMLQIDTVACITMILRTHKADICVMLHKKQGCFLDMIERWFFIDIVLKKC